MKSRFTQFFAQIKPQAFLAITLIIVAIFSRLIPHPWNMTAVLAATVFAGARLSKTTAFAVSFLSLLVSDFVLGFHSTMFFTYGAFFIIVLLSALTLKKNNSRIVPTLSTALMSSVIFFLITNLGVWLVDGMYPMTASGLLTCFVMAVPFFKAQFVGDLLFSGVLFYSYQMLASALAPATVKSFEN